MAKDLILVSHGTFCEELKKSVEMIMGPQEKIHAVGLYEWEGAEEFKDKFLEIAESLDNYIVLADLMGGTPCNVLSRLLMEGHQFELYAGMNMPMVIGFLNGQLVGEDVNLVEFARENTLCVNDLLLSLDKEEED
ncbi:PTS sugar transporter subunit IIA [Streptococcus sp. H49]|uniref:PTS sugar transporter subunit IIA n=1 Tax=Streptococcus huangxiaojuni TaxID=3237239 RepID=UPI0034A33B85